MTQQTDTKNTVSDELLPCPFCGGEANAYVSAGDAVVECVDCGAELSQGVDDENYHDTSAIIERWNLRSSIPGGVGVKVKALDWGERRAIHEVNWAWDAKTSIDWYVVATASGEGCKGTFYWFVVGYAVKGWANSEEEAKAAAQADYERRILSALDQLHKEGEQG